MTAGMMPQGVTGPGGVPGPGGPHMVVQNTQGLQQLQPNPGKVLATVLNTLQVHLKVST